MDNFLEFASARRSIRKFEEKEIPIEDIEYFIQAAVTAPSGHNSQCWRFVAIKDKNIINQMVEAVTKKVENIVKIKGDEISQDYRSSKRKMVSFFAKAPFVIAVFSTKVGEFDPIFISALKAHGYDEESIMRQYANFDILSVGAAIQNLLLAVHEKGYGACWMNDPAIAGEEINEILNIPLEQRFISLIPIGVPAYAPKGKKMKDMSEVFSII